MTTAIGAGREAGRSSDTRALLLGFVGVLCFSMSIPATRKAVPFLGPWFVTMGRAAVAGFLAVATLVLRGVPRPSRPQMLRLLVVVGGVVIGFPAFTGLALRHAPAGRSAVVTGLLPAATAGMAVLRARERPPRAFWGWAGLGFVAVAWLALARSHGHVSAADLLLLGAVLTGALGYTEGGMLARELGGWQTICWALVLALPVTTTTAFLARTAIASHVKTSAWVGFAYLSVVSMFLGFFAWYGALALGSIARVSQVQLLQPSLSLLWAALLLNEPLDRITMIVAAIVLLAVVGSRRATSRQARREALVASTGG
jgi:drug/metabolite transporter (DMT)-like permease